MVIPPIGRRPRNFISCLAVVVVCFIAVLPSLRADPTPSLDQITVIDQGVQLTLIWHFYPKLLPEKFSLPGSGVQVDLGTPATLLQNLIRLSRNAFTVTVDGKTVPPAEQGQAIPAPDGSCYATLFYAAHKNGSVTLQENILPLYPPGYVINYEIYSPLARARGVTGYFTGGAPSPVVEYTQTGDDYHPSIFDSLNTPPVKLFKAELRAAWINPSWLLLVLIVLLLRPAKELYPLAWIMALAWILPIFIWANNGTQIPFAIHPLIPALVTAAIAALSVLAAPPFATIASGVAIAGLLNGCLEIQRTTLERPPPSGANLTGLVLGLLAGFALIFAVALPILHECRKYPGFQRTWTPKIAAAIALLALVLAFVR
jgi:hypothetical protein